MSDSSAPSPSLGAAPGPPARIVVLTTEGSEYGYRMLNLLARQQTVPVAIVVRRDSFKRKWRLLKSVARRIGWVDAIQAAVVEVLADRRVSADQPWRGAPLIRDYARLAPEVRWVEAFMAPGIDVVLQSLRPDFIVLAQSGIVKDAVINSASGGVLNAHPGWLPQYRGVDVPQWTLHDDKPEMLASTLHFVDVGIDTGAIVKVQPFGSRPVSDFDSLQSAMYEDCLDLLAGAVRQVLAGQALDRTPQSADQGRQYYKMSAAARRVARANFDRWQRGLGAKR